MLRGSAVHEVTAASHTRQFDAKAQHPERSVGQLLKDSLPSFEEASDLAATAFDRILSDTGATVTPEDKQEAGSESNAIGMMKDATVDMASFYVEQVAPTVNPLSVEQKITIAPKDSDVVVVGVLDVVEVGPHGGDFIADLKTSEKSPFKNMASQDQQLTMYAMLRSAVTGNLPEGESLRYIVRTPARHEMRVVELSTVVTPGDVEALAHRINAAVTAIEAGIFVPASPGSWKCAAKWCEFYTTCKFAIKRT
jgi:hypothetical protein